MKNLSTRKFSTKKSRIFNVSCMSAIIIACIVLISTPVHALKITEIMFNPQGPDTGMEWIEIRFNSSDGCLNLTSYKLNEEGTNHNINVYRYDDYCSYAIICNDIDRFLSTYGYLNDSTNIMLNEVTIYKSSFSLSNSGENISIKLGSEAVDKIDYTDILDSVNVSEGYSMEYHQEDNLWRQSNIIGGNPGDMMMEEDVSNMTLNNTTNTTIKPTINMTTDNTMNTTSDNTTHATTDTTINNTMNTTINVTMNTTSNTSMNDSCIGCILTEGLNITASCNVSINIQVKNESVLYEDGLQIKFANKIYVNCTQSYKISDMDYSIEYWIEDLQGNILKTKTLTTNQDEKSYTPKIDEMDRILVIRSSIKSFNMTGDKFNITIFNSSSDKMIIVRNSDYTPPQEKTCPVCASSSTASKSTSKSSSSGGSSGCTQYSTCNQTPIVRTILFCNESLLERYNNLSEKMDLKGLDAGFEDSKISGYTESAMDNVKITPKSQITKNPDTQNQLTGAIIYESPNVKNRFYSIIGLVTVILACVIVFGYKSYKSRKGRPKNTSDQAIDL